MERLTEDETTALCAAQSAVVSAVALRKDAIRDRDALLRKYRARGVGVTELARAVPLHRSQVNRIVTEED